MADKNPDSSEIEKLPDDEMNRMLDAALAGYTAMEPRAGLEERILANLGAEQTRIPSRAWWQWRLAGAVAVILIIGALAWRSTRPSQPALANHPPAAIQHPSTQETNPAPYTAAEVTTAKHAPMPSPATRRVPSATAVAARPKLDQFPSPQPLSTEEIALAQYVKNFPKDAQLVAQSQLEFELETEKEMNDAGSESRLPGSIRQER